MALDLSDPKDRRTARDHLIWGDHGFLRYRFRNLHRIGDGMWRANQPSPEHIAVYARELGLKTILNLRGESPKGYYLLEKEACAAHGIDLIDFQVWSRQPPPAETILAAKDLFGSIRYPALMHCKSGADRAGIMAVLYRHFHEGDPIPVAREQLSLKYLHIRQGKTGVLDAIFDAFEAAHRVTGIGFEDWVRTAYDPDAIRAAFRASWWGSALTERILKRE